LLAVALFVVPDMDTVAPSPLGQAGVAGRVITCALLQLSLEGCEKITVPNNSEQHIITNLLKP
jgi:hypothetical protein